MGIEKFKNLRKGKRVFIVGNGPSLNRTNLDFLVREYSFAMNRIALIYGKTKWRPSYFVCTTSNIRNKSWKKDILKTINLGIPSFVWNKLKEEVGNKSNVYYINCTNGSEVTDRANPNWWSFDVAKRVSKFGTSMLVALQIAVYMGFDPIYIIGADLGYKEARRSKYRIMVSKLTFGRVNSLVDPNHFVSNYDTPGLQSDRLDRNMTAAHNLALGASKKVGVKIYNATVGGSLEVYPRVNFSELF